MKYNARYPVQRLIPGENTRGFKDDSIPDTMRTTAAWTCETPHCRYRESA